MCLIGFPKKIKKKYGSCLGFACKFSPICPEMSWIGCAILRRQIPNGSHDLFLFFLNMMWKRLRLVLIETHSLTFLSLIILASAGVLLFTKLS